MRHRIVSGTGFGNPDKELLTNTGDLDIELGDDALKEYFAEWEYFDYDVTDSAVTIGIEPAYQHERLRIICIAQDLDQSYYWYGTAFGPYGSNLVGKKRYYKDYKNDCKFTRFVEKHHGRLFK